MSKIIYILEKYILIILSLFIFIKSDNEIYRLKSSLTEENCQTPFECYLKAVEILKSDRAEMRRQMDFLNDQYLKNMQEFEKRLIETTAKYEDMLNQSKINCNEQIKNLNQNFQNFQTLVDQRINQVNNSIPHHLGLTGTHSPGLFSSCPVGYTAISCSCGSGCGSWEIQNEKTCHCGCGEWTSAFCLKLDN